MVRFYRLNPNKNYIKQSCSHVTNIIPIDWNLAIIKFGEDDIDFVKTNYEINGENVIIISCLAKQITSKKVGSEILNLINKNSQKTTRLDIINLLKEIENRNGNSSKELDNCECGLRFIGGGKL